MKAVKSRRVRGLLIVSMAVVSLQAIATPTMARDRNANQGFSVERQREPLGYKRLGRPDGIDARPRTLDRHAFNHNFQADRVYRIGPYAAPADWRYRQWRFGEILPAPFWAERYRIADFWLFGLDVPPAGFEWVRYGPDAILIDVGTGEVIQVDYGLFI